MAELRTRALTVRSSGVLLMLATLWAAVPGGAGVRASTVGEPQDPWQAAPSAYQPDLQRNLSERSERWEVSLTGWNKCPEALSNWCYLFRVEDKQSHSASSFRLANQTSQVDAVNIVSTSRLAILGRALSILSIVTVVDLPSGKEVDRIVCTGASLSPDRRYFSYLKFVPAHPGYEWSPSAEYLVYDLTASAEGNRTQPSRKWPEPYDVGWPLYPEGVRNAPGDNLLDGHDVPAHWKISPFVWFDQSDTVAFVDRYEGTVSLVLADLSGGIHRPKASVHPLDLTPVLDLPGCRARVSAADLDGWSKHPIELIEVKGIQVSPENKAALRLRLAPHPCLKSDVLDVPIGFRVSD